MSMETRRKILRRSRKGSISLSVIAVAMLMIVYSSVYNIVYNVIQEDRIDDDEFKLSLYHDVIDSPETALQGNKMESEIFIPSKRGIEETATSIISENLTNNSISSSLSYYDGLTFEDIFSNSTEGEKLAYKIDPPPEDTWLLKQNENMQSWSDEKIPKYIFKIFLRKDGTIQKLSEMWPPHYLKQAHISWRVKNPGYKIRYFDLHACRQYLARHFNPVFLRAFDCLEGFANKADLMRLLLVWKEGGWYSDWKEVCLVENLLENLSDTGDIIFFHIANSFFGAKPRHPVLTKTISKILDNVQKARYIDDASGPFLMTGPLLILEVFKEHYGKDYMDHFRGFYHGTTKKMPFTLTESNNETSKAIVHHKCKHCGSTQKWTNGNNYVQLYKKRMFYCQDSKSLFGKV